MSTAPSLDFPAFPEHPQRRELIKELHARPALPVVAPAQMIRFAFLTGPKNLAELAHLQELYRAYNVAEPETLPLHDIVRLNDQVTLRYERHTEFSTCTLVRFGPFDQPFQEDMTALLPDQWLETAPGMVIAATKLALHSLADGAYSISELPRFFDGNPLVGATIAGGKATHWTDITVHQDGFSRHLVQLGRVSATQAGRAVQRIMEIGTYRQMALLGLPEARRTAPAIAKVEDRLTILAAELDSPARDAGRGDEALLQDLIGLATQLENIQAETAWRFGASRAYHQLIRDRLVELRQERIEGVPNLTESLERRLTPAMRTCESSDQRQKDLAQRIYRLTGLLRARVDIARAEQNQQLLQSMDKSARQQLALQRTVEGLSTVAITYYALGLVSYGAKAMKAAGLPIEPALLTGMAVLPVAGLVYWGLRRMTHHVIEDHQRKN